MTIAHTTAVRTISFVDLAPRPGGSIVSLQLLAQGLPASRYRLAAILNAANPAAARLQEAGVFPAGIALTGSRQGLGDHYPAWVEQTRSSTPFARLRRFPPFVAAWQSAGQVLRIVRDILPQARRLHRLLQQQQPDLVHLNDIVPVSRPGILAASWLRRPIVCHVRALDPLTWLDRWLTQRVAGFIYISQAVADQQRRAGAHARRSRVVPNAINLAAFPSTLRGAAVRQELHIPHDAFLIGSVGRLVAWKGHHIALQAFAEFAQHCPTAHLLIAGAPDVAEPELERDLRQLAARLGIAQRTTFAGHRNDIPQLLAAIDLLCHCAVEPEPFGRIIIEGMAACRPVIASADGGVLEIIEPGVSGLLTPPGDTLALATALSDLWQHPQRAAALAAAGRERVEHCFTQAQHVAGVEALYDDILGSQGPA